MSAVCAKRQLAAQEIVHRPRRRPGEVIREADRVRDQVPVRRRRRQVGPGEGLEHRRLVVRDEVVVVEPARAARSAGVRGLHVVGVEAIERRPRARVGEHAIDLRLVDRVVGQRAVHGDGPQRLVRERVPQVIGEARGQLGRADGERAARAGHRLVAVLDEVELLRRVEEHGDDVRIARGVGGGARAVDGLEGGHVGGGDRPPERPRRELLEERREARVVVAGVAIGRAASDDGAQARRVRQRGGERDADAVVGSTRMNC